MPGIDKKNWTLTPANRAVRATAKWMPIGFICVIIMLVYFGVTTLQVLAAKSPADATLTAAELKDKIDELRWVLELILAASGLFTIAQGIAAGFSAKSFSDQAEGMLAEAMSRFKVFKLIEDRRNSATAYLASLESSLTSSSPLEDADEGFNWQRRFYEKMLLATREELLSAEQIFPYVVVGKADPADLYARNLRYLAQFYWAKFVYERERGLGYLEDIERAKYLLEQAMQTIGKMFYLLNDMGNIHLEYYKVLKAHKMPGNSAHLPIKPDRSELENALENARNSFKDSIQIQKKQLRPYYNLAFVARTQADESDSSSSPSKNDHLRIAIDYSNQGLQFNNWERKPVKDYQCLALYNLACYHALLEPADVEESLKALNLAAAIGLISPTDVKRDFHEQSGDFYNLLKSASHETKAKFELLEASLTQNYR